MWTYELLYGLVGSDGAEPNGGLVFDPAGSLYGTTAMGGTNDEGTAFELTPGSHGWVETVLYEQGSRVAVALDKAGNLYGIGVGKYYGGGIFELSPGSIPLLVSSACFSATLG